MQKVKNNILILGADGYLGSNLSHLFFDKGYQVFKSDLPSDSKKTKIKFDCDITNLEDVQKLISSIRPDIILHCAALSKIDKCEADSALAHKINVKGTENIIDAICSTNKDIKLIFISTDYVFDGIQGNYHELSPKQPTTAYGQTKSIAEEIIKNNLHNYIILRTANIFGKGGNFFNFVFNSLREKKTIKVFNNVFYTPTYIEYLLYAIEVLIKKEFNGIIHIAGKERISRWEFATKIATALGYDTSLIISENQPKEGLILLDSSLNTDFSEKTFGLSSPAIEKSINFAVGNLVFPHFYFKDERGIIKGIFNNKLWNELNYIELNRGFVRGNHYHKSMVEGFYVITGKIKVTLANLITKQKREFIAEEGDVFFVEPDVVHALEALCDSSWINMLSQKMDIHNQDIYNCDFN